MVLLQTTDNSLIDLWPIAVSDIPAAVAALDVDGNGDDAARVHLSLPDVEALRDFLTAILEGRGDDLIAPSLRPSFRIVVDRARFERVRALAEAGRDAMLLTTDVRHDRAWIALQIEIFNRAWSAIKAIEPGDFDPLP